MKQKQNGKQKIGKDEQRKKKRIGDRKEEEMEEEIKEFVKRHGCKDQMETKTRALGLE